MKQSAHHVCLPGFALLALVAGGCASYQPAGVLQAPSAEVAFSDEVSRDLVRQTRRLLALQNRDYLVGPDDVLDVSIFEWEMTEQTKTLNCRVAESGTIALPVIGVVTAAGKTVAEIQKDIETTLSTRGVLHTPRVAVAVSEFRSRRIAVTGAVNAPGVYAIHQNVSTLMDVLTLAGGPTEGAGEIIHVLREKRSDAKPLRITVDMQDLFDRGNFELNAVLEGGDVVYVPRAPLVYVYGSVKQPGGFALRRRLGVVEAVALAGGFAEHAARRSSYLVRRAAGGGQEVVRLNIPGIEQGRIADITLREGDVIHVPEHAGLLALDELWGVFRGIFTFTYRLDSSKE